MEVLKEISEISAPSYEKNIPQLEFFKNMDADRSSTLTGIGVHEIASAVTV